MADLLKVREKNTNNVEKNMLLLSHALMVMICVLGQVLMVC